MPSHDLTTRRYLQSREAAALAELQRVAPHPLKDYLEARKALEELDAAERPIGDYSRIRKPILAIEAYLREVQCFTDREVIGEEIEEGGFAKGEDTRPKENIKSAIRYHLSDTKRLVEKNGLVGLPEWLDDDLHASPPAKPTTPNKEDA